MPGSERSCIVCRGRSAKRSLLRFVWNADGLRFDELQRLPGRGAYVHSRQRCWRDGPDPAKWERALRLKKGAIAPDGLAGAYDGARLRIGEAKETSVPPGAAVRKLRL